MNLFGKKKTRPPPRLSDSIQQLREAIDILDKREAHLQRQAERAHVEAKKRAKAKDKRGALHHLKRKKLLEKQVEGIYGKKGNLEVQIMALESAASNKEIIHVMKRGKQALQANVSENDVDEVAEVMEDIQEGIANVDEISEAMAHPLGDPLDEDELDAEFKELEDELEELEEPAERERVLPPVDVVDPFADAPAAPVQRLPAREESVDEREARELAELESMMA